MGCITNTCRHCGDSTGGAPRKHCSCCGQRNCIEVTSDNDGPFFEVTAPAATPILICRWVADPQDTKGMYRCPVGLPDSDVAVICGCKTEGGHCMFPFTTTHRKIDDPEQYRQKLIENFHNNEQEIEQMNQATQETAMVKANAGTTITLYDNIADPMDAINKLGISFYESGMFGCTTAAQGRVLAMACLAEKKNPLEITRTYHIIDGKLSMRADAMLADFRKRGGKCLWKLTGDDGKTATAKFSYDGQELELSFTIEEAQRAELVKPKSGWVKNPGAMLRARLISKAIRMLAPEVVGGCYTPEELSGEVMDAEYEVLSVEPVRSATAPTVSAATTEAPKVVEAEIVKEPAADSSVPFDTETVDGSKSEKLSSEQLGTIARLKKDGQLPDDKWKTTLKHHYGVESARDLTVAQADDLIVKLETKLKTKADKDQLSDWANNALQTAT